MRFQHFKERKQTSKQILSYNWNDCGVFLFFSFLKDMDWLILPCIFKWLKMHLIWVWIVDGLKSKSAAYSEWNPCSSQISACYCVLEELSYAMDVSKHKGSDNIVIKCKIFEADSSILIVQRKYLYSNWKKPEDEWSSSI